MRIICRSSSVETTIHIRAAAAMVIDEAQDPHVMVSVVLIDPLSDDPRFGMPIRKFFNMNIYVAIGLGEEHILTWARKRLFNIVSLREKINHLCFKWEEKVVNDNQSTDVVAETTYSVKMEDSEKTMVKEQLKCWLSKAREC